MNSKDTKKRRWRFANDPRLRRLRHHRIKNQVLAASIKLLRAQLRGIETSRFEELSRSTSREFAQVIAEVGLAIGAAFSEVAIALSKVKIPPLHIPPQSPSAPSVAPPVEMSPWTKAGKIDLALRAAHPDYYYKKSLYENRYIVNCPCALPKRGPAPPLPIGLGRGQLPHPLPLHKPPGVTVINQNGVQIPGVLS